MTAYNGNIEYEEGGWLYAALRENPTDLFSETNLATVEGSWIEDADEPSHAAFGTLLDGRWWASEAWHDYTGWDCRSGADYYVGDTREDAIENGLTNDARSALGLELA